MLINYWDCKFQDYDEIVTEDDVFRIYLCTHPDNKSHGFSGSCELDNKWCSRKAECPIAERDK